MPFVPHTEKDIQEMLSVIGAPSVDALFDEIPEHLRCKKLDAIPSSAPEMEITREEIFGPILPILEYDDLDDAVRFITGRDHPLALYAFGRDARAAEKLVARTTSGGAVVNGAIVHLAVEHLPFGGVGTSGYGAYHGKRGFAEFTHARSVLVLPQWPILRDTIIRPSGRRMRWLTDWMIGR